MLNSLLKKFEEELEKYRKYLLTLPCEEAIEHSYEYTVKKDIVLAMENSNLSDEQLKALIGLPFPLEAIYSSFLKLDCSEYNEQLYLIAEIEADKLLKKIK